MPRTSPDDVPRLRVHPHRNVARVTLGGRDFNCGRPGTPESQRRYHQLIADWIDQGRPNRDYVPSFEAGGDLTIGKLVVEYAKHLKVRWPDKPNGTVHREFSSRRPILRLVRDNFGDLPVSQFGPKLFKRVRELVVATGVSRSHVNEQMSRVRQMLKWAVSEEYIPGWQLEAVKAVTALRRGDVDGLRDNDPVPPVPDEVVDQTLPYMPEIVADIVRVQRLTGARCGEVCDMKPAYIDTSGPVWVYTPPKHKTAHKGKDRKILIGPKAQAILRPYLRRAENSYCFSAREQQEKTIQQRIERGTIHRKVLNGINDDRPRAPRDRYSTDSVRRAVHRACDSAFPAPEGMKGDELNRWRSAHRWSPHQLRHTAATDARRFAGLECAQVLLGHSDQRVTQRYAEADLTLAESFVMQFG